jgi:hypothetical protein
MQVGIENESRESDCGENRENRENTCVQCQRKKDHEVTHSLVSIQNTVTTDYIPTH